MVFQHLHLPGLSRSIAGLTLAIVLAGSGNRFTMSAAEATARAREQIHQAIDKTASRVNPKVISVRRDIHQHPELGNREVRTARIVADWLKGLGLEVRTGVAHTGVVGILRGSDSGRVVALRADMDALPVAEEGDLPFKSKVVTKYDGQETPVMHACGHDAHTAILLGTAEVLSGIRATLPGTVVFIFQPAEEGAPGEEDGGAGMMIKEGVLDRPKVDAIFGLHVYPFETGGIRFRPRGILAANDGFQIIVRGSQTHGALPWDGADPIVVASQIVLGLQTIVSRQINVARSPAVVTIGKFQGGVRENIIPAEVRMEGIIRTFDEETRLRILQSIKTTSMHIAQSAGMSAEFTPSEGAPLTYNDPELTEKMTPSLKRVSSGEFNPSAPPVTVAEDFSLYQQRVPGLFFLLGVTPKGTDPAKAAPNHSPKFFVDEDALVTGVRAMASLAADYLLNEAETKGPLKK